MNHKLDPGLYIVATPIGNLGDITKRAAETLCAADIIAAEDSRVTGKLLKHLGAKAPIIPYHDHNAHRVRPDLLARMTTQAIVLVSDAGTPLISDPGYKLVREAREAGHPITTIPGACAAVAALTLAGLPTDRFLFMGFLPPKEKARQEAVEEVSALNATLVFYESGPRLGKTLATLARVLGDRDAAVAREITKLHEETVTGTLAELATRYEALEPKGEIVLLVGPPSNVPRPVAAQEIDTLLIEALATLTVAKAAGHVAKATGADRKQLYARALELKT
jgi:16S rRNA (cytidine1402-2'-O)-methyltransferase